MCCVDFPGYDQLVTFEKFRAAAQVSVAEQEERVAAQRRPYFFPHRNEHEWANAFAAAHQGQHPDLARDVRACVNWPGDPHFTDKRGAIARRIRSAVRDATDIDDVARRTIELVVGETCDPTVWQTPYLYKRSTNYLRP